MKQNLVSSFMLMVVTTVICLALGEVILALVAPQQTVSVVRRDAPCIFRESEFLPYELLPNANSAHVTPEFSVPLSINSLGCRGPEIKRDKGEQLRILVLGDSFTFGHGVAGDETYAAVLERKLSCSGMGCPVEVINAGYACCNYPDTYYLYLKRVGLALEPDVVIVGFFLGNDIDRQGLSFHEWAEVDSTGLPERIVGTAAHVEDGFWISNCQAARHRLPVVKDSHLAQAVAVALSRLRAGSRDPVYNELIYRREYADRTKGAVARVQRMFAAMKDLTDESGSELVVLEIPAYEQVFPRLVFGDGGAPAGLDLGRPQSEFNEFFSQNGILFLDALPGLRSCPDGECLYYDLDHHWTARGHEVAGELLAEWLLSTDVLHPAIIAS
jgi:hypothetical protein